MTGTQKRHYLGNACGLVLTTGFLIWRLAMLDTDDHERILCWMGLLFGAFCMLRLAAAYSSRAYLSNPRRQPYRRMGYVIIVFGVTLVIMRWLTAIEPLLSAGAMTLQMGLLFTGPA